MPGRTARARKPSPPRRGRSMLLGPTPDFKALEAAMGEPDEAHELIRLSQIRVSAALVFLNNNIGEVMEAIVREAITGRRKVEAAKLLFEITGVKRTGRGSTKPREPEGELEDAENGEEFDQILADAEKAKVFPIGNGGEGDGGR